MTAEKTAQRDAPGGPPATVRHHFGRWACAGIVLGIAMALLVLAGARLWMDALAFMDAPDRQAALKAGDGIVPEALRQRINLALEQQDFAAANMAMVELQRLYPNDVFVQSQAIYGRIMWLGANGGLTAEKRREITRDIRQVIALSGGNPVLLGRAQRMLALLIRAANAQQAAPVPDFAAQVPPSEDLPNSRP